MYTYTVGYPSDSLASCNGAMNYFDSDMFPVCKTCTFR